MPRALLLLLCVALLGCAARDESRQRGVSGAYVGGNAGLNAR